MNYSTVQDNTSWTPPEVLRFLAGYFSFIFHFFGYLSTGYPLPCSWNRQPLLLVETLFIFRRGDAARRLSAACSTVHVDVVVFSFNRSFYPTTSAVPPVSFLIIHPREIKTLWSQTVRQRKSKRKRFKVRKSNASVSDTIAKQKDKRHRKNKSYEKKINEGKTRELE